MSSIMGQIEPEHPEYFALEFGKKKKMLIMFLFTHIEEILKRAYSLKLLVRLSAHLSTECSVSYCDHSPSVGVRLSVHNFLVNALASTNIDQSAPNLVKMYVIIRSQMSLIMDLIRPELSELSALDLFDFVYTLASANIDQSVPNLATIYMPIRSRMRSIVGQIESERTDLFALEFGKIAENDFVYTLSSTNID